MSLASLFPSLSTVFFFCPTVYGLNLNPALPLPSLPPPLHLPVSGIGCCDLSCGSHALAPKGQWDGPRLDEKPPRGNASPPPENKNLATAMILLPYPPLFPAWLNTCPDVSVGFPLGSSVKIGTTQKRLAWPLRKDDTHKSRSVHLSVLVFLFAHSRPGREEFILLWRGCLFESCSPAVFIGFGYHRVA